jgi:predicted dehydrogenase
MREVARKMKVATQMGNQGSASNGLRTGVEIIQAGTIGPVREIHVWTNRPVWPQAPKVMSRPPAAPVPPHVHWDLWLGPMPERPYAVYEEGSGRRRGAYHDFNWRGWWDFGTGALGDMACHTANLAFRACKLMYPTSVAAECGDLNPETCPSWASVVLDFPARGDLPPLKFYWYEGQKEGKKNLPPLEKFKGGIEDLKRAPGSGSLVIGDKGTFYSPDDYGGGYRLLPAKDFEGFKPPSPTLPRHAGGNNDDNMKLEWVRAIQGGPAPSSNFDYAGVLTEAILLGNVAMRVGKSFAWDGENCRAVNCPEAEQYLKLPYRRGWTL